MLQLHQYSNCHSTCDSVASICFNDSSVSRRAVITLVECFRRLSGNWNSEKNMIAIKTSTCVPNACKSRERERERGCYVSLLAKQLWWSCVCEWSWQRQQYHNLIQNPSLGVSESVGFFGTLSLQIYFKSKPINKIK